MLEISVVEVIFQLNITFHLAIDFQISILIDAKQGEPNPYKSNPLPKPVDLSAYETLPWEN